VKILGFAAVVGLGNCNFAKAEEVCKVYFFFPCSGIMVKLTMIARVTDGLPLAEGLDDGGRDQKDIEFYKQQAKQLCKRLSQQKQEPSRMSVETGPYFFQYPSSSIIAHSFWSLPFLISIFLWHIIPIYVSVSQIFLCFWIASFFCQGGRKTHLDIYYLLPQLPDRRWRLLPHSL
jgi:hypothetical protein